MVKGAHKLSVCMATYNGARYLSQQLDSIAAQSRRPDELVVSDDCSIDDTPVIVRNFSRRAPFPVRLYTNEKNLGISANFQQAVQQADGDILLLCDQDDVWRAEKIRRVEEHFAQDPDSALVFHDTNVVDEHLRSLGYTFWDRVGFCARDRQRVVEGFGFDVLLAHSFVAGATLAFRARFRSLVLPLPEIWLYDAWIVLTIASVAKAQIIPAQLADYRQHPMQVMGGRRQGLWRSWREARHSVNAQYFVDMASRYDVLGRRLVARQVSLEPRILPMIEARRRLCLARAAMRSRPLLRYPLLLREVLTGRYHRLANGWKSVALDVFV
ncbi:MAG: hypothetical protein BWK76_05900 [Desulfobulbaceae bacterium A2]|nr:MAG: hypothetical protein BWK76_05900 [Desulfobulbaceae bacterium A2]